MQLDMERIESLDAARGPLADGVGSQSVSRRIAGAVVTLPDVGWRANDAKRRSHDGDDTSRSKPARGQPDLYILLAVQDPLRRLQTGRVDRCQMHHVDRATPWEEIWQAMDTLVDQGKVIYVISLNFVGWHIAHTESNWRWRRWEP